MATSRMNTVIPVNTPGTPKSFSRAATPTARR